MVQWTYIYLWLRHKNCENCTVFALSLYHLGFPGGSDGKESAYNSGNLGSIPGSRRSPGEGNGNPPQCSCLENPMDREAWWATVHGITQSQTWLSNFHMYHRSNIYVYVHFFGIGCMYFLTFMTLSPHILLSICLFLVSPLSLWDLSSPIRDQTQVLGVRVRSPKHWTAREFLVSFFLNYLKIIWKYHDTPPIKYFSIQLLNIKDIFLIKHNKWSHPGKWIINWLLNIQSTRYSWGKSNLRKVYYSFKLWWIQFANSLLMIFASMFMSELGI